MKIIKTATFLILGIVLVNCGGDSSSSEPVSVSSLTKQARVNQVSATSVGFREQSSLRRTGKMQLHAKQDSGGPISCEVSGTYYYKIEPTDDGGTLFNYSTQECKYRDSETGKIMGEDGKMSYVEDKNGVGIAVGYEEYMMVPDINNPKIINYFPALTIVKIKKDDYTVLGLNGEAKFSIDGENVNEAYKYKDYFYVSNDTQVHIEGSEKIITSCGTTSNFYEDYNNEFNILTKHNSEPRYYKSGIIVVNGLKYDYRGEDVILSKGTENERVSQASILAQKDTVTSCSQKSSFEKPNAQKLRNDEYLKNFTQIASKLQSHISKMEIKK